MMNRRAFVTGLGVLVAAPVATFAQHAAKVPRIGILSGGRFDRCFAAFQDGMSTFGYVAGRNVIYEDGPLAEMLRHNVEIIVAANNPAVLAAQKATSVVPIVMVYPVDPNRLRFGAKFGDPGW